MPAEPAGAIISAVLDELRACLAKVRPAQVDAALEQIASARRIFLAAAGRSALGIRGFAIRLMHMGKTVHVVGEPTTPAIAAEDLLILGSGSGRTESLLAMAQKARQVSSRILLLTIDTNSPLARLAHHVVQIPAPSPKVQGASPAGASIQPMGSLFEQALLILLDCLVLMLMAREGLSAEQMFARHANLE